MVFRGWPAAALLLLAACGLHDTWSNRVEPVELGPVPPDHVLRRPADFRLHDPHVRKEFFLFLYEDENGKYEIVTVINYALPEGVRTQRLATREEFDYAMALFEADWRARGDERKLRYFNERHREEMERRATLLDTQIVYKRAEVRDWEEQVHALESDRRSRKEHAAFASGDEKFPLPDEAGLQRRLAHARRRHAVTEAQLFLLEYYRALRDAQYARVLEVYVDTALRVDDLVPAYLPAEKLVSDIRAGVQPWAWQRPDARISFSEGELHVRQTRDVLIHVRDHLDWLRGQAEASRAKAQELKPPKDPAPK
jgi:hypothetical protein